MTAKTSTRPHTLSTQTAGVPKADRRTKRLTQTERPTPTAQATHEQEADRWVAQMMFENYNY
ncbi:hypothetical protein TFLX_04209 [Thermoflexales bacterium]|nr:hypothetical protein TFLX_04209 [Thermoflexales bacterium]